MTRIVYCIGSYRGGQQLHDLIEALLDGESVDVTLVIHHDTARSPAPALPDDPRVQLLTHSPGVRWGTPDFMRMLIRTLEWVVSHCDFDWCYWITEQDFPLRSVRDMRNFLDRSAYDGHIAGTPLSADSPWPGGEGLVRYGYRYPVAFDDPTIQWVLTRGRRLLRRVLGEDGVDRASRGRAIWLTRRVENRTWLGFRRAGPPPWHEGYELWGGHMWFTLNRSAIVRVLAVLEQDPAIWAFYRQVFMPCESLLQTVLFSDRSLRLSQDNLRFVRWLPPESPRPATLTSADLEDLRNSAAHFARKFDPETDSQVLDQLRSHLRPATDH